MTPSRPLATSMIEPVGFLGAVPREHAIKITVPFSGLEPKFADKGHVLSALNEALSTLLPDAGSADAWRFHELTATRKSAKAGSSTSVVGVEATAKSVGRPDDESVGRLRAALIAGGYAVEIRERRECEEPSCTTSALVTWDDAQARPHGWYTTRICGAHNYRECSKCKSVYVLTSTNAAGQNPSIHCEVCGLVLIEWGSSKLWSAVLVTRGPA